MKKLVDYSDSEDEDEMPELEQTDDFSLYYDLTLNSEQNMPKFHSTATSYKIRLKNIHNAKNVLPILHGVFDDVLKIVLSSAQENDRVGFFLNQVSTMDHPLVLPYCKVGELSSDRILSALERMLQSNAELDLYENTLIKFTHIKQNV